MSSSQYIEENLDNIAERIGLDFKKILPLLNNILVEHSIDLIVVGLPRSLNGQETNQSKYVRDFARINLKEHNFVWQDETLSTVSAQSRMKQMGFEKQPVMLDSVAACIILEDYILTCT